MEPAPLCLPHEVGLDDSSPFPEQPPAPLERMAEEEEDGVEKNDGELVKIKCSW